MQQTLEQITSRPVDGPPTTQLVHVLRGEVAILEELRAVLARQRQGVATNDHQVIETSVREMGRALFTLEEARRGRQALVAMLCGRDVESLTDLESWFPGVPEDLIDARDAVRASAASAARDLAVNQHVLDRALQAGDAFLQRLFSGGADANAGYRQRVERDEPRRDAVLVNRTA
jgi:hypothetical protein